VYSSTADDTVADATVPTIKGDFSAAEQQQFNRPNAVASMVMLSNAAALGMVCTPGIVTAFIHEGAVTAAQATMLGSTELAGMTASLVLCSFVMARANRRWLAFGAVVAAALGHLLLAYAGSYPQILACQFLAGFGEGAMAAVAVATIAGTAAPDRIFGLNVASNLVASSVFFSLLPRMVSLGGVHSVEWILCISSASFGLGIPWIPRRAPVVASDRDVAQTQVVKLRGLLPGALGLCGTLAFLTGVGSVWPLIGQIGFSIHVPTSVISSALATAGLCGIAAALFATWLGVRFGRVAPLVVGALGLIGAMAVLLTEFASHVFFIDVIGFMVCWIFTIPYFFGLLAAMDKSGRLVAFSAAMQTSGLALGQALSAFIVGRAAYVVTIYAGISLGACALLATLAAVRLHRRSPPPQS
jgi:predicted MFS family arabinose efflux permease